MALAFDLPCLPLDSAMRNELKHAHGKHPRAYDVEGLDRGQRVAQIVPQILDMLHTYRQPDQPIADP